MNWLDVVILLFVLIPAFMGFRKGFMRKILGIAGIIIGFILAVKFYVNLADLLSKFIKESPMLVDVISFLLIIAIVYGLALWLAKYISDIGAGTNLLNRLLGTIFGFIQGLIVTSVLLYNLSLINFPSQETVNTSLLYKPVYKVAPAVFDKVIQLFPALEETYRNYKEKPAGNKK